MNLFRLYKHLPKSSLLVTAAVLIGLSFLSAWFFGAKPSVEQQRRLLEKYVQTQEQDADHLLRDTAFLRKLVEHRESAAEFTMLTGKRYGLFLFAETFSETHDLLFWNSQEIIPPPADFSAADSVSFQLFRNGYYVVRNQKFFLPGISSNNIAYVLIPVLNKYYLETANSQTQFAYNKEAVRRIAIAEGTVTDFPIRSVNGSVLFYVSKAGGAGENRTDTVTVVLRLLALMLVLVYAQLMAKVVRIKRNAMMAIGFLALVLIAFRVLLFLYPGLFSLRQLHLFDPSVYAADLFNRSLGDLLITALFLCWLVVFAWQSIGPAKRLPSFLKKGGALAVGLACIFALVFTTFQLAAMVHDLITASKISFDVTDFFNLSSDTVFGFIVLALLTLLFYYFSRLLFRLILLAFPTLFFLYCLVAVAGLSYLTLRSGSDAVLFQLPVLGWLVVYTLLLSRESLIINRIRMTAAGILFWIFVFSVSLAVLIMQGNGEREWQQRRNIADKVESLNDPAKESTLRVTLASLNNDFLKTNFYRFYNETDNAFLRDSITTNNHLGYAGSYSTDFYVFDAQENPVNNGGSRSRSYNELNNIIERQSRSTGSPDLFYYEASFDQFVYITKREIRDSAKRLGYLFLVATPRQFGTTDALYPNLFTRTADRAIENSPLYSYAVYKNGKLLSHSSKYSFATEITAAQIPEEESAKRQRGDYDELWYKGSKGTVVVVAKKKDAFIESITLFSYLFCAFLLMVGLLQVSAFAARVGRPGQTGDVFSRLNIRTQIHGTILFISVLSFLIIGAATINFFISRYNRSNEDRLSRVSGSSVTEMEKRIEADNLLKNNALDFSDSLSRRVLQTLIKEIADEHGVIVNLYDITGTLQVTSDNEIYQRGVLNTRMHPLAFFQLDNLHDVQYVQKEKAAQLAYLSIYTAIRNRRGDTYAYLNIPSFTSQLELNQEISNFLVTIINLNAFIFLIAGVLALFITNRITHTFSVIGDKMRDITLGRTNEEIVWEKNDEIGELVKQYNKMVQQLEQSAEALAKSEREGAWREMARQVAHEIKNPLTPMKLSIQYLQRAIESGKANVQELTANVAATLIEQIDHLSKIAADFSQFAAIGNKRVERMDLHGVIGSLVSLYDSNEKMDLRWNALPKPVWMQADKTQMNRLFTNLLQNAVDACAEGRRCVVTLNESTDGENVIVSVADNGEGIPAAMQAKIFTPNLTTKSSGTGLGLAMCKSIVEQSGGAIWFETEEGRGTVFYVKLPVEED